MPIPAVLDVQISRGERGVRGLEESECVWRGERLHWGWNEDGREGFQCLLLAGLWMY